jgi:hypothetical protein
MVFALPANAMAGAAPAAMAIAMIFLLRFMIFPRKQLGRPSISLLSIARNRNRLNFRDGLNNAF